MDTGQTTTWKSFACIHSLYPHLNLTSFFLPTKDIKTTPQPLICSPTSRHLACHISFRPFLNLGPNLYIKLPYFTQYFLGVRLRIASWVLLVLLTDVFSRREQLFLPQSANKSICWALCIERTNISNMKEARHLVSHLWLTAPGKIKHNVTIYQAEFLGTSYWRLQQQDPLLLFVHLFEILNKFLHWNFRYQRKHSMSKCLLRKIN